MRIWHRRSGTILVAVALLGLAAAGAATSSSAAAKSAVDVTYYQLINHDGKCLDIVDGDPNGKVQQRGCNGNHWQYWAIYPSGFGGYLIKNHFTQRCLEAAGDTPGSAVVQGPCTPNLALQNWYAEYIGTGSWFEYWSAQNSGGCDVSAESECAMHPSGGSSDDGKGIYIQFPNSANNLDSFYWRTGAAI